MKKLYEFRADGIPFLTERMTPQEAKAYAKEFQLTYKEVK